MDSFIMDFTLAFKEDINPKEFDYSNSDPKDYSIALH